MRGVLFLSLTCSLRKCPFSFGEFSVSTKLNLKIETNTVARKLDVDLPCMYNTTWTLTKRLEKKLDGNYTRMLRAILNKSWRQHLTKHQLYGHLPPIMKTIKLRRTRHALDCWRSRDDPLSDVLLWTPLYGQAKAGQPARTYIQQLSKDTGYSPEDPPETMNIRGEW